MQSRYGDGFSYKNLSTVSPYLLRISKSPLRTLAWLKAFEFNVSSFFSVISVSLW